MNETIKSILEAMAEAGAEKIGALKSAEELQALLAEQGVNATMEEIQAAVEAAQAFGKSELSEESLEQVAGGGIKEAAMGLVKKAAPEVLNFVKKLLPGLDKDNNTTNTQNNNNNRANQQNSINGNNSMQGGMTCDSSDDDDE